jgi:hypothetical protein
VGTFVISRLATVLKKGGGINTCPHFPPLADRRGTSVFVFTLAVGLSRRFYLAAYF